MKNFKLLKCPRLLDTFRFELKYWNGSQLMNKIIKYPQLISKHWYKNQEESIKKEFIPTFNKHESLKRYSIPPYAQKFKLESFPVTKFNKKYFIKMKKYSHSFSQKPSLLTLIDGEIGAGKTLYGWHLMSILKKKGYDVAGFNCATEFNNIFFDYELFGETNYLILHKMMEDVDCLFLDEFGYRLDEKSHTRKKALDTLIQIVNNRVKNNKIRLNRQKFVAIIRPKCKSVNYLSTFFYLGV